MKHLLLAIIAVTIASCNTTSKVQSYFTEHCPNSKVTKLYDGSYRVTVECSNLYDTTEIKKYVDYGRVQYDFVGAKVSGTVISKDSIPDMYSILVKISKGIKRK